MTTANNQIELKAGETDPAYRDLDNTYDPGGRLRQLAIRFNW